ncbi:MAG: GNAT family N-acetyltransferase [bacterium]|nr:GNAT family N-acetyltransferase [bacterium]
MKPTTIDGIELTLRIAALEEIIQLRHDVLIVGTNRTSPEFDGDRNELTRHYGAFRDEKCVCCLSLMASRWENHDAWQLRGMATRSEWRGRGAGGALLRYALNDAAQSNGVRRFWCNARTNAVRFYQRQGWRLASDEFDIEGVGPHYRMTTQS